jgi:hypothetical protein
MTDA